MTEYTTQQQDNLITHLDRIISQQHPEQRLITQCCPSSIIEVHTSAYDQLNEFYAISNEDRLHTPLKFSPTLEDTPEALLNFLSPFNPKLEEYHHCPILNKRNVREAIRKHERNQAMDKLGTTIIRGAVIPFYIFTHATTPAEIYTSIGLGTATIAIGLTTSFLPQKHESYAPFRELENTAHDADRFIEEIYQQHLT